jgi:glucokinase
MIGAGTGMGHGFMTKNNLNCKYFEVFSSEGGHCDFAPQSDLEWEYMKCVQ